MLKLTLLIWSVVTRVAMSSFFMVEGPSMEPTLYDQQLFAVDRYIYEHAEPRRGDIVVFSLEDEPDYYYVKRVIGLPGEKLTVDRDGVRLHFTGSGEQKVEEPYLPEQTQQSDLSYWTKSAAKRLFIVPVDKYFVLGDNRAHSLDSRYFSDHYVPKDRIIGKYLFTVF